MPLHRRERVVADRVGALMRRGDQLGGGRARIAARSGRPACRSAPEGRRDGDGVARLDRRDARRGARRRDQAGGDQRVGIAQGAGLCGQGIGPAWWRHDRPAIRTMPQPAWHPEALAARLPFLRRRALLTAGDARLLRAPAATPRWRRPTPCATPGEEVHLPPSAPSGVSPTAAERAALAAHQPGIRDEAPARGRRRADLPARPRLAQRRGQRPARARVHHAGMVSPRRRRSTA